MSTRHQEPAEADIARPRGPLPHALVLTLATLAAVHAAEPVHPDRPAEVAVGAAAAAADLRLASDDAAFLLAAGRAREAAARLVDALAAAGATAEPATRMRAENLLAEAHRRESADSTAQAEADRIARAGEARAAANGGAIATGSMRAERLARIRDLRVREHHELALAHCRSLLRDLPGDEEVDALYRELLDETHTARKAALAERERELRSEVALMVERSLIPEGLDGMPMFPSDWGEERVGRPSALDLAQRPEAWEDALADRLAGRTTIQLDSMPLQEALNLVARLGGVNVIAAPELLASERLITLRAVDMRLDSLLSWIAEQAGTTWGLASSGVYVGEQLVSNRSIVLHDLAELLVGVGDFPGLQLAMQAGDGSGGAGFLSPAEDSAPTPTADDIADLIRRSISPSTWEDPENSMVVRGTTLVVTAPPAVHRLIREFLRSQSAQRSLMVRVDLRWLELTDTFAEEIGVQWISGPGTFMTGIPGNATGSSGLLRQVDGWAVQGGTINQLPANSMSLQATGQPGMVMQAAYLGGTQLSAILSASERNHQGRVLRAPEVACLNGQRANAFFGNQIAYISDYEIVSGNYDPVITVLNIGSAIDVRPLVSADRRYVTMELRAATATTTFTTEVITAVQIISTGDFGVVVPITGYPIELPNVEVREIGTSVMLPDRGSLLVGGFTGSLDQFAATRIPLLGSVPFLGRLFGARGRYAEKRQLNLLTTVTIINYPELEARL